MDYSSGFLLIMVALKSQKLTNGNTHFLITTIINQN